MKRREFSFCPTPRQGGLSFLVRQNPFVPSQRVRRRSRLRSRQREGRRGTRKGALGEPAVAIKTNPGDSPQVRIEVVVIRVGTTW